jgi:arginyl-tRNA synthetase
MQTIHPLYIDLENIFLPLLQQLSPSAVLLLGPAARPEFGDVQINGIMPLAKQLKRNPRELASEVLAQVDLTAIADKVEIAGPGFINIVFAEPYLTQRLSAYAAELLRPLVLNAEDKLRFVVDYSGPNLAKEMHVGHLRSTIIGDALVRSLRCLGHDAIAQNHVGDWGTQFGMLTAFMEELSQSSDQQNVLLSDLENFYRSAKQKFDEDPTFAAKARDYVVRLQQQDPTVLAWWKQFVAVSLEHCQQVYQQLGVLLQPSDVSAESSYNDDLPVLVKELQDAHLIQQDQGAWCAFSADQQESDKPTPFIIQKQDGAYLYATTDLAALRYRVRKLGADKILYVVDARQSWHFEQLFGLAQKAAWLKEGQAEHIAFGTMMGEDGKPFKTRTGGTVKLADLLQEAQLRALNIMEQKSPDLSAEEQQAAAQVLGIAAVKYADLAKHRLSDYKFDWDSILSFEGNTAPYLLYTYARLNRVITKAVNQGLQVDLAQAAFVLNSPEEKQLALHLMQFSAELNNIAKHYAPHYLCLYLYQLAQKCARFYEACPVLDATLDEQVQKSRVALIMLSNYVLKLGLECLGIEVLGRM